jgi:peroxiredoxin
MNAMLAGARTLGRALAIAVCVLLTSCGASGPRTAKGPSAPDFALPSLDGKTVNLSDYRGKSVVLIDFWSTTCDPCMVEMPHLVELYKKHKDKGFVVLAVSLDGPESRAQVSAVVHDKEMIFPVLLDEETTVVGRFNPKKDMPFAVLIDKDGSIVHKRGGYQPGDEKSLAMEIEKALAQ